MNINKMSCCNWGEISFIGRGQPDGAAIMRDFLNITYKGQAYDYRSHMVTPSNKLVLYTVYVFSGPVNGYNPAQFNGFPFAKFISENSLGEVHTTTPSKNKAYHPGTLVQAWMWVPDQEALQKYWEKNCPEQKDTLGNIDCAYFGTANKPPLCPRCEFNLEEKKD